MGDAGFLDGCFTHGDAHGGAATLVSFHFVRFALFAVLLTVAGPLVHRVVAALFDLERDFKSVADHFDDVTSGLLYAYLVFTLGNYAHTLGWVTLVFYFVGLLGFCLLVELPFMRISIPSWRTWSVGAWAVNLAGLAAVVLAAVFHIRWAYKAAILQWYLPLFALATSTVWLTVFVKQLNNYCVDYCPNGLGIERQLRRLALVLCIWRDPDRAPSKRPDANAPTASRANDNGAPDTGTPIGSDIPLALLSGANGTASAGNAAGEQSCRERAGLLSREEKNAIISRKLEHLHYLNAEGGRPLPLYHYQLHLHHWQIFYILAFFTRFDRFASQACAGLVLGIFTQGISAYGFDPMMERT
ncbi:hypothetical protein H4R21_001777 [Coemansia helicoidea]|uniref:Uncharacterized protein n=1 Tax=Coemansia helicoidea TaxID=1286919 RepID=A0ACC1LAK2_9FUNG|nr:hypothetical protein H4R21_001777 [Coemansia helicoidea]